jgi:hypothetical protein
MAHLFESILFEYFLRISWCRITSIFLTTVSHSVDSYKLKELEGEFNLLACLLGESHQPV